MNTKSTLGEALIVLGLLAFLGGAVGYAAAVISGTQAAVVDVLALLVLGIGLAIAQSQSESVPGTDADGEALDYSLTNFGAGLGLAIGAGVGLTTALVAGTDLALTVGYGVAGGLVIGAFVGRFAETTTESERENPGLRVLALALFAGIAVGGLLGVLVAWSVDESLVVGLEVGSAAGGLHAVVLANLIIGSARRLRRGEGRAESEPSRPA